MAYRPRKKSVHKAKHHRCKRCGGQIRKQQVRCKKCSEKQK